MLQLQTPRICSRKQQNCFMIIRKLVEGCNTSRGNLLTMSWARQNISLSGWAIGVPASNTIPFAPFAGHMGISDRGCKKKSSQFHIRTDPLLNNKVTYSYCTALHERVRGIREILKWAKEEDEKTVKFVMASFLYCTVCDFLSALIPNILLEGHAAITFQRAISNYLLSFQIGV